MFCVATDERPGEPGRLSLVLGYPRDLWGAKQSNIPGQGPFVTERHFINWKPESQCDHRVRRLVKGSDSTVKGGGSARHGHYGTQNGLVRAGGSDTASRSRRRIFGLVARPATGRGVTGTCRASRIPDVYGPFPGGPMRVRGAAGAFHAPPGRAGASFAARQDPLRGAFAA